jgi:hypothetical protein
LSSTPYEGISYWYLRRVSDSRNIFYAEWSAGQFLVIDKEHNIAITIRKNSWVSPLGMLLYRFFDQAVTTDNALVIYDTVMHYSGE